MIEIRELNPSYIDDAVKIFAEAFAGARQRQPLIPEQPGLTDLASRRLERAAANVGFAAFDGAELVGYMVEVFTSDGFMGTPTGFSIGLYPCTCATASRGRIQQLLYTRLSSSWIERGFHAHQFSCFASDEEMSALYFRLGFGMTHFQFFRDLSSPGGEVPEVDVRYLESERPLREVAKQHEAFYPNPPLFWIRPGQPGAPEGQPVAQPDRVERGELEIIAAFVEGRPVAYFELKKGTAETEFFTDPGNGQIGAAYSLPEFRGRGIGKALLAETVRWATRNGLERLYVEGESANIFGGNFWCRHFNMVEISVRRVVDSRVSADMFSEPSPG